MSLHQISSGSQTGFLETWFHPVTKLAFPPVLNGAIVMEAASSMDGVQQE